MPFSSSIALFVVAGLCEIGGGYLVWLWLREGKSFGYAAAGAILLILYGVIPTCKQPISGVCTQPMAACSSCSRCYGDGARTEQGQIDSICSVRSSV